MWLIVGLGNPGLKYQLNRHNIGFVLVDIIVENIASTQSFKKNQSSEVIKVKFGNDDVVFAKPQTFMNRSGEAVQALMSFYKTDPDKLLVVQDDIDQPFAGIKFQSGRGHGGHNGIRSIHEQLGTDKYMRLKIGVGRPTIPQMDVADWVLQNFSNEELKHIPKILEHCYLGIESLIKNGYQKTATLFNKNLLDSELES
ncbi:MAG: aminoacyl-tRNA hydrolase [Pseudomonadota bacterium]|nr:aminoacyl-tRNA hydrolase [Pseudomonadota bacterium]